MRTFVAVKQGVVDSHRGAVHEYGAGTCLQCTKSQRCPHEAALYMVMMSCAQGHTQWNSTWTLEAKVVFVMDTVELMTMSVAAAPYARLLNVESRMTKLCPSSFRIAPGSVSSWTKSTPARQTSHFPNSADCATRSLAPPYLLIRHIIKAPWAPKSHVRQLLNARIWHDKNEMPARDLGT